MTDELTAMEADESRLTPVNRLRLDVSRTMFMFGEIDEHQLHVFLVTELGFTPAGAEEYVNSCADANDGDPC